jgi:hypothetical protein
MGKKRREKKEKRAELARQLGKKADALSDKEKALMGKSRVGHFFARPLSIQLEEGPDGVLSKLLGGRLELHLSVFLVDGHGIRKMVAGEWNAALPKKSAGAVTLEGASKLEEEIRYERPAHFVALVTPDMLSDEPEKLMLKATDGGEDEKDFVPLADKRLSHSRWEKARSVMVKGEAGEFSGAAITLSGVHKHKSETLFVFQRGKHRLGATFSLKL